VLAIFKRNGGFGALAKSNFSGLRYREPVYRSLRELVMSYFEDFFNRLGRKTLRSYTVPLDLATFDGAHWETNDTGVDAIEQRLKELRPYEVLTPAMIRQLSPVQTLRGCSYRGSRERLRRSPAASLTRGRCRLRLSRYWGRLHHIDGGRQVRAKQHDPTDKIDEEQQRHNRAERAVYQVVMHQPARQIPGETDDEGLQRNRSQSRAPERALPVPP
jgi:hypothetical protein